nr:hypothetical protein [Tanacetum cinerariifolium]
MIFDGMLRNLDNVSGKFLMYPRFIQTFLDKQLDGLPTHKEKYAALFHTKKVFTNIKRIGIGFSGKETPLFPIMVRPNQVQMGEGLAQPTDTQHTPTFGMPPLKPKKTQKPRQPKRKTTKVPQPSKSIDIAAIDGLERRVKKLEKKHRSRTHKLKRLYKVGLTAKVISSTYDEALDKEDTFKQGRIDEIDIDEDIAQVSTHDDVGTQDNIVKDEGIEDVREKELVKVVTTTNMIVDIVVDVAHVTTAIADITVSAAETIVTTAPTITAEYTKINVKGRIVGNKMHKAFPLLVIEFPLAEEVPTASEESFHCQKKRDATAIRIALLGILVESDTPKKKKLQEQIDAQMDRELEEQQEREDLRMNKQIARDVEVARIHAEEEIQAMIDSLDKSNETVAKYLQEYQQFSSDLSLEKKIELIGDLVKYQDHYKKLEDFIPMGSKEEAERLKRKGLSLEQESAKKLKSSDEVPKEHMDREDMNQLWDLVKESLSNRQPTSDKEMELWVELKRLYEPDDEDQLWTHTQNFMHAPVEWKLYDMCRVHQVTSKDKEIFMLVEKDYPLRKEEVPTASEESSHCQKKRDATAKRIVLLGKCPMITPRL